MSSQSGSEYEQNQKGNKTKKIKVQQVVEKRSRRSARKNVKAQQNQNPLPENIPVTESTEFIIYHSFQLQVTKDIIQIPLALFKSNKMSKEIWTRVGETILSIIIIKKQQLGEIIIQAKIKDQQNEKQKKKKASKSKSNQQSKKNNNKKNNVYQIYSESDQQQTEITFLVWGKISWIGSYQVISKTIKQSPKILNNQIYVQMVKMKIQDTRSDIFIVLSMKKKIQTVNDYNGLINQGNTCYMNSYLQMLSHISQFKNLVFEAPIQDQNKFPATLQVLFYKLDNQQKPVSAQQLVKSFGWTKKQVNIQQDAQQFSCLFYQVLERKLQQACPKPQHMSMSKIFQGNLINII